MLCFFQAISASSATSTQAEYSQPFFLLFPFLFLLFLFLLLLLPLLFFLLLLFPFPFLLLLLLFSSSSSSHLESAVMTTQDPMPRRGDTIQSSYKLYKQEFDNYGDPASFLHSLSILDEFVVQEASREELRVSCTALHFSIREVESRRPCRRAESTVESFLSELASAPRAAVESDGVDEASFLIVENLCPETVVKLGRALRIPPQFWSEYVENRPWFWGRCIAPQWLTLPSVQATQGFTKTQWVVPRPFRWEFADRDRQDDAASARADTLHWVKTDLSTSRVHRVAGIMRPRTGEGELMASVAFIRETLMVWMSRDDRTHGRLVGKSRPTPSARPE